MTYPEWLPTWPSNWPDIVSRYVDTVPRVWPKRLYKRGGKVFADLQAIGEALSAPRRLLEFAVRTFLPPADVNGMWIHLWEADFGVKAAVLLADRQKRLAMRVRLLNQSTAVDVIKAVFAEVFGVAPADLSIGHVSQTILTEVNTLGDVTAARCNGSYHVFPTAEDTAPNLTLGRAAVAELEQAVGRITFGRYQQGCYRRSTYRRTCYSRAA